MAAREQAIADKQRALNARESRVVSAEDNLVELMQVVTSVAFARGAADARGQDLTLDQLDAALALPSQLGPVAVDLHVCGHEATVRVLPGSSVTSAEVLASVLRALDSVEEPSA